MDRRRAGRARVLDPRRRLEAERGVGLKHQRCREFLADKPAIHCAEIDRVDVGRRDPGIDQRRLRDLDDQRLDVPAFVLTELAVRPTHDAPGHATLQNAQRRTIANPPAPFYHDMGRPCLRCDLRRSK